jgi:hypothetical protein
MGNSIILSHETDGTLVVICAECGRAYERNTPGRPLVWTSTCEGLH